MAVVPLEEETALAEPPQLKRIAKALGALDVRDEIFIL